MVVIQDTGARVLFVIRCACINLYCSKFSPVKETKGLLFSEPFSKTSSKKTVFACETAQ